MLDLNTAAHQRCPPYRLLDQDDRVSRFPPEQVARAVGVNRLGTSAQMRRESPWSLASALEPSSHKSRCKSKQSTLLGRLRLNPLIALHTREVAGSKPAAPILRSPWRSAVPGRNLRHVGSGGSEAALWRHRRAARARAASDRSAEPRRWAPGRDCGRVSVSRAHPDRTPTHAERQALNAVVRVTARVSGRHSVMAATTVTTRSPRSARCRGTRWAGEGLAHWR